MNDELLQLVRERIHSVSHDQSTAAITKMRDVVSTWRRATVTTRIADELEHVIDLAALYLAEGNHE